MTDYEVAVTISMIVDKALNEKLSQQVIEFGQGVLRVIEKKDATQYRLKQNGTIAIELPELSKNDSVAVAQVALAVGRRLERFERGRKANAKRTPNSRKKIAQNAVQSRWNAK